MPRFQDLLQKVLALPPRQLAVYGGGVALVLVGLIGVPYLLDGSRQGQNIAQQIAQATGQRVRIEGGVHVGLLPTPSISLENVQLISKDGAASLFTAERVELDVSFASLFGGSVELSALSLTHPSFTIAYDPTSGAHSWLPSPDLAKKLGLKSLQINKGQFVIQNGTTQELVTGLNGSFGLAEADATFDARLSGMWRKAPLDVEFYLSAPQPDGLSYVRFKAEAEAASTSALIEGKWPVDKTSRLSSETGALDVSLEAHRASDLWATLATIDPQTIPLAPQDPALQEPLKLKAEVKQSKDTSVIDVPSLSVKLGPVDVAGLARYQEGQPRGLSLALRASLIDLAAWPSLQAAALSKNISLPQDWLVAFDLSAASVLAPSGLMLEAVEAKGNLKNGSLVIDEAAASLAGTSRLTLSGKLTPQATAPLAEGRVTFNSTQLRSFMDALQIKPPEGIDDTALRQLDVTAQFRGAWPSPDLSSLEATLDGAVIKGTLTPRFDAQGGLRLDGTLSVARFDPSRYGFSSAVPSWLWQLPTGAWSLALSDFRLGGQYVEKASVAARLMPDAIAIQSADLSGWVGSHITLAGTIARPHGPISTTLTSTLQTEDFSLLRPALENLPMIVPSSVAGWLSGPMVVSSRLTADPTGGEESLINIALQDQGKVDLVLTRQEDALKGFKVRVQHPDSALVLNQLLGSSSVGPENELGPLDLYAEGSEAQGGLWSLRNMRGHIGSSIGLLSGDLSLAPMLPSTVRGALAFSDLDLDALRHAVSPSAPALLFSGGLSFSAQKATLFDQTFTKVTGSLVQQNNDMTFDALSAKWHGGEVSASGKMTLAPVFALDGSFDIKGASADLSSNQKYGLMGVLDVSFKGRSSGMGAQTLWANLEGDGDATLSDGTLTGLDFVALSKSVRAAPADKIDIPALLARGGTSALQVFGGDFTVEEGRVSWPKLTLIAKDSKAEGALALDLRTRQLDGQTALRLGDKTESPTLKLQIGGSLDAPSVAPDAREQSPLSVPETPEAIATSSGKMKVPPNAASSGAAQSEDEALSPKEKKKKQAAPTVTENDGITLARPIPGGGESEGSDSASVLGDAESMTVDIPKLKHSQTDPAAAPLDVPKPPSVHNYDAVVPTPEQDPPMKKQSSISVAPKSSSQDGLPPPPSIDAMLKSLPQLAAKAQGDVAPVAAPLSGSDVSVPATVASKPVPKTVKPVPSPAAPKATLSNETFGATKTQPKAQPPKTVVQDGVAETRYGNLVIRAPAGQTPPPADTVPMPTFEAAPQ